MFKDGMAKTTLAPLVLRVALGAIFIYHGLQKVVGPENLWGAGWANVRWQRQARAPQPVVEQMDKLIAARETDEEKTAITRAKQRVSEAFATQVDPMPDALGYHAAQLAVAWGELLGGFALLLGILTRLAAVGLLVIQAGAIYTVTLAVGFSPEDGGGYEYNVALIAMCLALVLTGGGALAVDNLLRRRREARRQAPPAAAA
jgi:uncharacterized membrane protein YphA (DoxX/SURF4 family)